MSIKGFYINGSVQKYDYESLDNKPASGDGLTEQAKRALLACFEQVAWIGQDGQSYYDALEEALYPQGYVEVTNNLTWCRSTNEAITAAVGKPYTATIIADSGYSLTGAEVSITMGGTSVTGYYSNGTISIPNVTGDIVITVTATSSISSISAVFTQGSATIYDTDSLDTLRQYLTVTAYYADTTSATVNDYELSGTLTVGTSTITVSYGGKTTTFSVTVSTVLYPLENGTHTFTTTNRTLTVTNGNHIVFRNDSASVYGVGAYLNLTTVSANDSSGNSNGNYNVSEEWFTIPSGASYRFAVTNITHTSSDDGKYTLTFRNGPTQMFSIGDQTTADDAVVSGVASEDMRITCLTSYVKNTVSLLKCDVELTVNGVRWI